MKPISLVLVWVSVLAALVGFFVPWAVVDVRASTVARQLGDAASLGQTLEGFSKGLSKVTLTIRRGAETVTGELPSLKDIPRQVSGVQIPQMANQENAKVALALIELVAGTRQYIGLKSYAVYLVPGIALLCGLVLIWLGRWPAVGFGTALVCAGIAGVGFWKLLTTNTQTLFVAITIGPGLWLSLWAYGGLAIAGGLRAVHPGRRR